MKKILVIAGPSGAGKSSLAKALAENNKDIYLPKSHTTRARRKGENDDEYYFTSKKEFLDRLNRGEFLEHSTIYGNLYGTSLDEIAAAPKNKHIVLVLDLIGVGSLRGQRINGRQVVDLFLVPWGVDALRGRLEDPKTNEGRGELEARLNRLEYELEAESAFTYSLVNDELTYTAYNAYQLLK